MFQFIFRLRGSPGVESGLLDPFRKNATPGAFLVYWIYGFDVALFVHVPRLPGICDSRKYA